MPITPHPDSSINRQVQGRIAGRGLNAPCRIMVATAKGAVTLTGTVRTPQQKVTAVQAARGVSGVRNVVDQIIVQAAPKT